MILRRRFVTLMLLALLAAVCGCNSLKTERMNTALDESVKTYRKLLRWGYYEEAAQYFRAREESVQNSDIRRLGQYKITSCEIVNQLIADTGSEARVVALVDFYNVDTGVVESLKDEQYWWYDEMEKRWYLGSPVLELLARTAP